MPRFFPRSFRTRNLVCESLESRDLLAVTLNFSGGLLFEADGSASGSTLPDGRRYNILIDTEGDGFGDLRAAIHSVTVDDDDVLLTGGSIDNGGTFQRSTTFDLTGGIDPGDPMLLVFYDASSANPPGPGTPFGTYRNDAAIDGSISWHVPADGTTADLKFLTESVGGSNPDTAGETNLATASVEVLVDENAALRVRQLGGFQQALTVSRVEIDGEPRIRLSEPNQTLLAGPGTVRINSGTLDIPLSNISPDHGIRVSGSGLSDTLTIDYSGGLFGLPLEFLAGSSNDGLPDQLIVTGAALATASIHITSPIHATINIGTDTIAHQGAEHVDVQLAINELSVTSDTQIRLSDTTDGQVEFLGQAFQRLVTYYPRETLLLDSRVSVEINELTTAFDSNLIVGSLWSTSARITGPIQRDQGNTLVNGRVIDVEGAFVARGDAAVALIATRNIAV